MLDKVEKPTYVKVETAQNKSTQVEVEILTTQVKNTRSLVLFSL